MTHPHIEGYSFTETFIPALFSVRYFGDTTMNKMAPVVKEPKEKPQHKRRESWESLLQD